MYDAIQGESTLAGMPCTLIRLAGCPLHCSYCDTPAAIPMNSGQMMLISDIVERVRQAGRPLVLVTGGEPLAQKSCIPLLEALTDLPAIIQLETSGALDISAVPPFVHRIIDIKTPGSGEAARNREENIHHLRGGDELKFVLTSREDYQWSLDFIHEHRLGELGLPMLFSPCWGMLEPRDLADWLLRDNPPVRLQLQQHKSIWGAETSGV